MDVKRRESGREGLIIMTEAWIYIFKFKFMLHTSKCIRREKSPCTAKIRNRNVCWKWNSINENATWFKTTSECVKQIYLLWNWITHTHTIINMQPSTYDTRKNTKWKENTQTQTTQKASHSNRNEHAGNFRLSSFRNAHCTYTLQDPENVVNVTTEHCLQ